jgi:GNAT superfamily N-acetyltransferase
MGTINKQSVSLPHLPPMNIRIVSKPRRNFIFRSIMERDVRAFSSLFKLCFGHRPSEKYIRWRYFGTPTGTSPTVLAIDKNTCVASFMFWPTRVTLDGKEVMAGVGADAMTHPDYRGRGLFVSLVEKGYDLISKRGYQFFFAFPNDKSLPIAARRLNWDHVCDIHSWVRPLWVLGTSPLSGIVASMSLLWSSNTTNVPRIVAETPAPEETAFLATRCEETKDICRVKRDREWFAWRYHADSDRNYKWLAAYVGTELKGVAVWRFDPTIRRVFLCELIGDSQSIPALLKSVLRAAYRQKARAIEFPTNDPALIPLLKSNGFIRRSGHHLVVRSCTDKILPANIHRAEAWRIYGGDIDYF